MTSETGALYREKYSTIASLGGRNVSRIPIMAKSVLDLYNLFKLVTERGGLVEVINKKIWREITRGLNLPSSITSAAFTLRTQYMKYLFEYECHKFHFSNEDELRKAVEVNRREGRRSNGMNGYDMMMRHEERSGAVATLNSHVPQYFNGHHTNGYSSSTNGFLLKTDKSKDFSHLTKGITDAVPPPDHATLNIEDDARFGYTGNNGSRSRSRSPVENDSQQEALNLEVNRNGPPSYRDRESHSRDEERPNSRMFSNDRPRRPERSHTQTSQHERVSLPGTDMRITTEVGQDGNLNMLIRMIVNGRSFEGILHPTSDDED
ncbi:AT-rich interactive domain-containing protein 3A [Nymphon striatum]|nr:AT-rich interactive domain-containing protein 3A [Nymphon striatum]